MLERTGVLKMVRKCSCQRGAPVRHSVSDFALSSLINKQRYERLTKSLPVPFQQNWDISRRSRGRTSARGQVIRDFCGAAPFSFLVPPQESFTAAIPGLL